MCRGGDSRVPSRRSHHHHCHHRRHRLPDKDYAKREQTIKQKITGEPTTPPLKKPQKGIHNQRHFSSSHTLPYPRPNPMPTDSWMQGCSRPDKRLSNNSGIGETRNWNTERIQVPPMWYMPTTTRNSTAHGMLTTRVSSSRSRKSRWGNPPPSLQIQ